MNEKLQRATGTYMTTWKKSNGGWRNRILLRGRESHSPEHLGIAGSFTQRVQQRVKEILGHQDVLFLDTTLEPLHTATPVAESGIDHREGEWRHVSVSPLLLEIAQDPKRRTTFTSPRVGGCQIGPCLRTRVAQLHTAPGQNDSRVGSARLQLNQTGNEVRLGVVAVEIEHSTGLCLCLTGPVHEVIDP